MKFEEFVSKVDSMYLDHKELRYGQAVMNVLKEAWPDKYEQLTGTDDDCFYLDALVKGTLEKLESDWP
jgi:hypothetical protein